MANRFNRQKLQHQHDRKMGGIKQRFEKLKTPKDAKKSQSKLGLVNENEQSQNAPIPQQQQKSDEEVKEQEQEQESIKKQANSINQAIRANILGSPPPKMISKSSSSSSSQPAPRSVAKEQATALLTTPPPTEGPDPSDIVVSMTPLTSALHRLCFTETKASEAEESNPSNPSVANASEETTEAAQEVKKTDEESVLDEEETLRGLAEADEANNLAVPTPVLLPLNSLGPTELDFSLEDALEGEGEGSELDASMRSLNESMQSISLHEDDKSTGDRGGVDMSVDQSYDALETSFNAIPEEDESSVASHMSNHNLVKTPSRDRSSLARATLTPKSLGPTLRMKPAQRVIALQDQDEEEEEESGGVYTVTLTPPSAVNTNTPRREAISTIPGMSQKKKNLKVIKQPERRYQQYK